MSVKSAAGGTLLVSATTLLVALYGIFAVYSEVSSLWTEFDNEIESLRAMNDDAWKAMLSMGAGTPSTRARRQSNYGGYAAVAAAPPPVCSAFSSLVQLFRLRCERRSRRGGRLG